MQSLAALLYGNDGVSLMGAPGCGKTFLISGLTRSYNATQRHKFVAIVADVDDSL